MTCIVVARYVVRVDGEFGATLPLIVEIDEDGGALLSVRNEPIFASNELSTLLEILGVDKSALQVLHDQPVAVRA